MPINVRDIMTNDMKTFSQDVDVEDIIEVMDGMKIDFAPIVSDGEIVSYVNSDKLKKSDDNNELEDNFIELSERNLIGTEVPILSNSEQKDLIHAFYDNGLSSLFCVDEGIIGIVSIADLNKPIASLPFYRILSKYESTAKNLINSEISGWKTYLSKNSREESFKRYNKEKKQNAHLRIIDNISIEDVHNILKKSELSNIFKNLGYNSRNQRDYVLKNIKNLRNNVMHNKPLVGEQNFDHVVETVDEIQRIIPKLKNQL